jgi:hypothetical protein
VKVYKVIENEAVGPITLPTASFAISAKHLVDPTSVA